MAKGTKNRGMKPWWHVREAEGIQGSSGGWGEPGEGRRTLGCRAGVGNTRGGSGFSQSFPATSRKEAAGTPVQVLDLLETEKKAVGKERGKVTRAVACPATQCAAAASPSGCVLGAGEPGLFVIARC